MPVVFNRSDRGGTGKKPAQKPGRSSGKGKGTGASDRKTLPPPIKIAALVLVIVAALAFIGMQLFGGRRNTPAMTAPDQVGDYMRDLRPPPFSLGRPAGNTGVLPPNTAAPSSGDIERPPAAEDRGEGIH